MKLVTPIRLGHIAPSRALVRLARGGTPLDFTHGVSVTQLPDALLRLSGSQGYVPTEGTCLGLHGRGSIAPHTDDLYGEAGLVWLVADTGESQLMVARGGRDGVMPMAVGDVVLFPSLEYHAWISRSAWAMFVLDVSAKRQHQHRDYRTYLRAG